MLWGLLCVYWWILCLSLRCEKRWQLRDLLIPVHWWQWFKVLTPEHWTSASFLPSTFVVVLSLSMCDSQQEGRPIVILTIVLVAMTARTTGGASTRNVKKPDKTCPLRARCESSIHPTPFPEHQCVVAGRKLKLKWLVMLIQNHIQRVGVPRWSGPGLNVP